MTAAAVQSGASDGAHGRRIAAETAAAVLGLVLLAAAWKASPAWFDRHFLPVFFVPFGLYRAGETAAGLALAALGLVVLLWARPALGRAASRATFDQIAAGAARIALALGLAGIASEAGLSLAFPRAAEEVSPRVEPQRQPDPVLGWTFKPGRVARQRLAGRVVDYAFDIHGYRTQSPAQSVDFTKPTALFVGESIVAGAGLPWDQSFPAEVGQTLGLQPANLAVFAYADDQTYLRLARELPRFQRPVAVVMLFSPGLMFRDFDEDRPHLSPGLEWRPAARGLRLLALAHFFVPYHSQAEIDRVVGQAQAELAAGAALARRRGAEPLIVVPRFGPEDPREAVLRRRVLDAAGLPYVEVGLDPSWRQPHDPHPDARGARAIADTVTARLTARLRVRAGHASVDGSGCMPTGLRCANGRRSRPAPRRLPTSAWLPRPEGRQVRTIRRSEGCGRKRCAGAWLTGRSSG